MPIEPAMPEDIPALLILVNSAFRGESSKKGWTHEADLIIGEARTDEAMLLDMMLEPNAMMLKYRNEAGRIEGCVYLQVKETGLYLGMLTVEPELQNAGIGKKLLTAADAFARKRRCTRIYMSVISVRKDLIAWYERHGYTLTGETAPFAVEAKYGVPSQALEFAIMEKQTPGLYEQDNFFR